MELANARFNNFFNKSTNNKWHVDNYVIDEQDDNNAIVILADHIPERATVLDVGCAQGKFGSYLHDVKGCKMYGIEINQDAIKFAQNSGKYEDVFCFDLEQDDSSLEYQRFNMAINQVDCIIISDVLEHLADPTNILHKMGKRLTDKGKLLISVPNIAHADIYLNLMNGIFNYSDLGILDNTHLKFWTKRSFAQWIKSINDYYDDNYFDCSYIGGTYYCSEYLMNVKENYKSLFNFIEASPEFNVLQLLFTLTKLPQQAETPNLDTLINEPNIDTVKSINDALCANMRIRPFSMYAGERHWYEGKINILSEQISFLSEQLSNSEKHSGWLTAQSETAKYDFLCLREQNDQLRNELNNLRNSLSWKITSPLRWLKKIVK